MGFRLLISLCLCFPQTLFSQQKIWVRSPYSSFEDFQIFIKAGSALSYAEHLLKQERQRAKNFQLKKKLISAQQLYLEGKETSARAAFLEVSHLAYSADWDSEDRRIFLYAFLRLAQFERDKEKQKAFLILAQHFLGFPLTQENYQDFELFPPPLMNQLKEIQTKSPVLTVSLDSIFPNHEILLLNGERIDKKQPLQRFQAHYRLTALSSSHEPWSKTVNLSKLLLQEVQTQSLSFGLCSQEKLKAPLKQTAVAPVSNCPSLNPLELRPQKKKEKNPDSSKKALWVTAGAGALILSLMFFLTKKKEEPEGSEFIF